MRSTRLAAWAALSFAAAMALAGPTAAQTLDDKLRAQLRTVLGQLHDLQNNQATLEAEKARAEQERDGLKAKLAAGGGRAPRAAAASSALQAQLDQAHADNARLTEVNQQAQAEITRYKEAYAKVIETSQEVHAERDRLAQAQAVSTEALAVCETKNIQLVKLGRDVLAAYTKIGVRDALARGEPMIGLKRVKMERIAQDYADKVYEAKFDPRAVKPPAPPAAVQPAQAAAAPQPVPTKPVPTDPGKPPGQP
jgi:DNA repair exonuclease SbcCD ATPase subunit